MTTGRTAASLLALTACVVVTSVGVTWSTDAPPPRLERDVAGPLFDDVHLLPGQTVTRCATIRPRGDVLTALEFDGSASGSLAPEVRLQMVRGVATSSGPPDCSGFVPVATVYDGPLNELPAETDRESAAVAIPEGTAIAYRATIGLGDPSASGTTAMRLRVTGVFADRIGPPTPALPPPPPPPNGIAPERCRQRQSDGQIARTAHRDGRTLDVRTPRSLPVTLVRPLPVYVRVTGRGAGTSPPQVRVGPATVPVQRTAGGRWRALVPLRRLRDAAGVGVRADGLHVVVPVRTADCGLRVRTFLRSGSTVDLRIDAAKAITGARLRLPAGLGRANGGRIVVRYADARGRARVASGSVGRRGRGPTHLLPGIRVAGRTVELTDVPPRIGAISIRLRVPNADRLRPRVCRNRFPAGNALPTTGDVVTDRLYRVRVALAIIGDRCPARAR